MDSTEAHRKGTVLRAPPPSRRPDVHWISASFILLLIISVGITSTLVLIAARSQDRVAIEESSNLIKSVISDINSRLNDQLKDYSYWDEAVDNLVGSTNLDWADNNIGIYMFEEFDIAASFVLNTENYTTYAMIDGNRISIDAINSFGKDFEELVTNARDGLLTERPLQVNGIVGYENKIYLASASVLTRFGNSNTEEIRSNWVLVF